MLYRDQAVFPLLFDDYEGDHGHTDHCEDLNTNHGHRKAEKSNGRVYDPSHKEDERVYDSRTVWMVALESVEKGHKAVADLDKRLKFKPEASLYS